MRRAGPVLFTIDVAAAGSFGVYFDRRGGAVDQRDVDWDILLSAARDGDHEAVAELLRRASPALRAHVEGEIGAAWRPYLTADDVLQETYLDAFKSIHRFVPDGESSLLRWLKRIASHNIADAIRGISTERADGRRAPRQVVGFDPYVALLTGLTGGTGTSVSGRFVRAEATALLKRTVQRLPDEQRAIVERFDLMGMSMHTVAAELRKTVGAAYLLRKRALEGLRGMLESESTIFRAFS